jgi:hypothetical protein
MYRELHQSLADETYLGAVLGTPVITETEELRVVFADTQSYPWAGEGDRK